MTSHEFEPKASFERWLAHDDLVRRLARRIVGADADDVVQDAWVAALRNPAAARTNERGWLARVARNRALEWLRGNERRRARESTVARSDVEGADVAEVIAREEERRRLVDAVVALAEPYRTTLILHDLEGLSLRAVAARLRVPVDTIKTRRKRGLARLRAALLRQHGGDRRSFALALAPLTGLMPQSTTAALGAAWFGGFFVKWGWSSAAVLALVVGVWVAVRDHADPQVSELAAAARPGRSDPTDAVGSTVSPALDASAASPVRPVRENVAPERVLRGAVSRVDGAPIAAARVVLVDASDPTIVDVDAAFAGGRVHGALTGSDGAFACALPLEWSRVRLCAIASGMSPTVLDVAVRDEVVDVRLAPSTTLSGRVTDEDSRPIANAEVVWSQWLDSFAVRRTGTTAADGTYRVEGIPTPGTTGIAGSDSARAWIDVAASEFAPEVIPSSAARRIADGAGLDLVIRLSRGRAVTVRVVDGESANAVPDARVVAWSVEGPGVGSGTENADAGPDRDRVWAETRTDARGVAVLQGIPDRRGRPPATSFADARGPIVGFVAALDGDRALACEPIHAAEHDDADELTLKLIRRSVIRGTVVDVAGTTVPAHVALEDGVVDVPWPRGLGDRVRAERSAPTGGFELPCVLKDANTQRVRLSVSSDRGRAEATVELTPGSEIDVGELVVGSDLRAILELVDPAGHPIQGAEAESIPPGSTWPRSDERGRIELEFDANTSGQRFAASIWATGFGVTKTPAFAPAPRAAVVRVVLEPERVLRGRVVESDGATAAGCFVRAEASSVPRDPWTPRSRRPAETLDTPLVGLGGVACDAMGRFELRGLPDGPYRVYAVAPEFPPSSRPPRVAELDGVVATDAPCELRLPARLEAVGYASIHVVDAATGAAFADADLRVESEQSDVRSVLERIDVGVWRIEVAPATTTRVRALAPGVGFVDQELPLATGDNGSFTIELGVGTTIRGVLRLSDAAALDRAELYFVEAMELRGARASLASDGSFVLRGVSPGTYRPRLWFPTSVGEGSDAWVAQDDPPLVVESGIADVHHDVDARRGGEFRLVVRPRVGPPGGRPSFVVEDDRHRVVRRTRHLDAGESTNFVLAPGNYVLNVVIDAVVRDRHTFTVTVGKTTRLAVDLPD